MVTAIICEKMGWTYYEYIDQPLWFLRLIFKKLEIDNKNEREAARRAEARSPKGVRRH